tara:strand:- start:345 stop:647 length:303 start_codon:yes stop_codon:yes gene_type:complete
MASVKAHVIQIAHNITNGVDSDGEEMSVYDYLEDALDIEYICNSARECIGARILVAFGGPNIWVDTRNNIVKGAWWDEHASQEFEDNIGLNDAIIELFNC